MASTTGDVLNHHLEAFGNGDLEGLLGDYTDQSVLMTPDGALKGVSEIAPLFQQLIAEFAKPGASFEMKQTLIDGDVAYIVWSAETADNVYEVATDTFVVRDGKIASQTFAAKVAPKS